ncbi:MAG TPA: cache domain-containing protein [Methanosarcina sp.]
MSIFKYKSTIEDENRKIVIYIASLLCLLSFLLLLHIGYEYKSSKTDEIILEEAKKDAQQQADFAVKHIYSDINSTSSLTEEIAKDLSSGKLKDDSMLRERLLAEMKKHPNIYSIVVAYSPSAHAGKFYAPHFMRNGSEIVYAPVTYDYTKGSEQTAWYNDALKKGSTVWISPYFGIADANYQIDCSAPFYLAEYDNGHKAAGVVSVSYSLEEVRAEVGGLKLGNTGYGYIISRKGVIISYPLQDYLAANIHDLAKKDPNIYFISKNTKEGEYWATNSFTGKSYWVFQKNIPSTDWILGLVLPQEETLINRKTEQTHSIIQVVFAAFTFLFLLCLLFVSTYMYNHRGLWLLAFIFSLLCILEIGLMWYLAMNSSTLDSSRNGDLVVFDRQGVFTVMQHANTSRTAHTTPTGLLLQSIDFSDANNVIITGFIWQNTSALRAEGDFPDFIFPDSKETIIEKTYVSKDKDIIVWHFRTTLRQQFDYSRYPFAREEVSIRVLSTDPAENIFIPDFDSYSSLIPETLPGLGHSFVLDGWKLEKSFFSYRITSYNTDFGMRNFAHSNVCEFHFNTDIKRNIRASYVSDLLLITIAVVLLFGILTITSKDENKKHFGFSSHGVLAYCTTLLFTLIIAHTSLRSKISVGGIIYLEYFYWIMYLAIVVVSLNAIAFASNRNVPFIDTKDNIYIKILYWPVVLGFMLFVTFLNFY